MSPIVNEQFDRLMRKSAFKPILRFVTGADAEDRLAEGIAQTFELAQRKAARGERMDDPLVVYAARLRALDIRRQFVKGGQPRRDACHRANYTDGRTAVFHLDFFDDESDDWRGGGEVALEAAWAAATSMDPADKLNSAIDLAEWLSSLSAGDRALLAGRLAGMSLQEVADRADLSLTVAFQRLRRLGEGLAAHAGIAVTKKKCKPRGRNATARC